MHAGIREVQTQPALQTQLGAAGFKCREMYQRVGKKKKKKSTQENMKESAGVT